MTIASEVSAAGGARRDDPSDAPATEDRISERGESEAAKARDEKERLDREAGDVADDLADFA